MKRKHSRKLVQWRYSVRRQPSPDRSGYASDMAGTVRAGSVANALDTVAFDEGCVRPPTKFDYWPTGGVAVHVLESGAIVTIVVVVDGGGR